ncbi:hypothetical protein PRIPAC_72932 [Pristionchus pacificus]|uniref:Uncharacterized protein n=1 Tax=Pristionchus pacificus TaxID=54126 RepID=A0A2A6CSV4_PRIPA|nr:hypothetical protein PRIPAC_72932 [Pristionchus pacificus]|eukprot:PDM81304.1 hypothetical protein PRIPAC_36307 [Pristionchus pacificus]
MTLTVEEAKAILAPILASYDEWLAKGDVDGVSSLYSPDGVLVHKGNNCAHGRDQIKHALVPFAIPTESTASIILFLFLLAQTPFHITNHHYEATSDHIIFHAVFSSKVIATCAVFGGKFETIYRKEGDQWLIIFDEFQA